MTKDSSPTTGRDAKRARFTAEQRERRTGASPLVLVAGLVVLLAIVGGMILLLPGRAPTAPAAAQPAPISPAAGSQASSSAPAPAAAAKAPGLAKPATQGHAAYEVVSAVDGAVRLPLSTFDDFKAHFYSYVANGQTIEFFVIKSQDGVVRAAFNACDVCFGAKLGYRQEGDEMVCNNCGSRFPTDKINEVRGGCNPSPLTRTIVGDTLVILETDLAQGQSFF